MAQCESPTKRYCRDRDNGGHAIDVPERCRPRMGFAQSGRRFSGFHRFLSDGCLETVATFGNCSDVIATVRLFSQGLAEGKDVLGECGFLNEDAGPDAVEQCLLSNHMTGVF